MKKSVTAIMDSLKTLLESKPYDKITVLEICQGANVSRRTFYTHFDSKDDIVEAQVLDDLIIPVKNLKSILTLEEVDNSTALVINKTVDNFCANKNFYKKLLNYQGNLSLMETIAKVNYDFAMDIFNTYNLPFEEAEFVCRYVSSAQAAILVWWIKENPELTKKKLAEYMTKWVFGGLTEYDSLYFDNKSQ